MRSKSTHSTAPSRPFFEKLSTVTVPPSEPLMMRWVVEVVVEAVVVVAVAAAAVAVVAVAVAVAVALRRKVDALVV